ncbi:MAG: Fic family protein [Chlamydiota bacterium]
MKSSRDKKLIVLHQLSQEAEPISLLDLSAKLEDHYPERTVRRWLNEFVDEGLVEKLGKKRGTKYIATDQSNHSKHTMSSCFGSNSVNAIKQVRRPLYEREPVVYNDNWFNAYVPNETFYIQERFRMQLHRTGKRSKNGDPAGTYAHQIFNRLLIDLSYNSSRLEGNTYSLLDTEKLIFEGTSAEGKLDEEKVMILNHKEAIRYLVDIAPRLKVDKENICTLHYLLADGLLEARYAGKVRDHPVRVGGSTYLPFEDPKRLQIQLERIIEKAAKIEDPFEQSLFLLVHISYVQAFSDVNKRTARLSANIPLIMNNLVPLSFNDVDRDDYMSAMIALYELQDVFPIIDLYVFSYMRTCAAYDFTVKSIGFDEVRVRYRQKRRAIVREIIDKKLVGTALTGYVKAEVSHGIPEKDQKAFFDDVFEDLREMDQSRLAGLGVTAPQLEMWKKLYNLY